MLRVMELKPTRKNLRAFIGLPFEIYRDDPNWVPPLIAGQMRMLLGKQNGLFKNGVHKFFMAYEDGRPVARVLVGIDDKLVARTGVKEGYFSLFESYDRPEYAKAVLDAAADFLRGEGIAVMIGPNPPTFDDFQKGLLIEGFDGQPFLYNAYNQRYAVDLLTGYGMTKYCDHYAYRLELKDFTAERYEVLLERAQNRFGFRVQQIDPRGDLRTQIRDVARCVSEAFPRHWNLLPPTEADIEREFRRLRRLIDPRYAMLAYAGERPVGFTLALPDYNQLLKRTGGRLTPRGLWVLLTQRRRVDQLRAVMQFVVPEYQNKAVNGVLYYKTYLNARDAGIRVIEGSTIDEHNLPSILSMEKSGGQRYRVYRQYKYALR